jgi:hypothetical protein
MAFCFLQWLSGFPQRLSAFLNGFPLSKKSKKSLLNFPQWLSSFQEI